MLSSLKIRYVSERQSFLNTATAFDDKKTTRFKLKLKEKKNKINFLCEIGQLTTQVDLLIKSLKLNRINVKYNDFIFSMSMLSEISMRGVLE